MIGMLVQKIKAVCGVLILSVKHAKKKKGIGMSFEQSRL